jgi:hypothetical protein
VLADGRLLIIEDGNKYHFEGKSNLYCLNRDLIIDWFVNLPYPNDLDDVYVGFTSHGENIFANTWSCYRVEVDIGNGQIKNVTFTK